LLDRLTGVDRPYETAEQVQADLIALQGEPTRVTAAMRSAHLALLIAALAPFLIIMLSVRYFAMQRSLQSLQYRVELADAALEYLDRPENARTAAEWVQGSPQLKRHTVAEWRERIRRRLP